MMATKEIPDCQCSSEIPEKSEPIENNSNLNENQIILKKDKYWFQYIVAISATLLFMSSMTTLGWTSPSLPILLSTNSPIEQITSDEGGWIMVAMLIGSFVSPIPAAYLMDTFGRKLTLFFSAIPIIIGWLLIAFAKSITWIYCARMCQGLTYGVVFTLIPMYLGEIASDQCRGSVLIIMSIMNKIGFIFVYSIGSYVSIFTMALISLTLPTAFSLTFIFMPESPYFLIDKNKFDDALISLKRLRRHSNVAHEFEQIKVTVQRAQKLHANFMDLFAKDNRRSLLIMIGLSSANQLCGGQVVLAYAGLIFGRVDSPLKPSEASIILVLVQLIAAVIIIFIVDRVGRRVLLIGSCFGTGVANTIVFIYFLLERLNVDVSQIGLIAVIALLFLVISYSMGLGGVPLMLVGEIFPKHLRAYAGASFALYCAAIAFGVGKLFQVISDELGSDVSFGIFAICSFLFILFFYYIVPETKGRSLDEIQELLKSNKNK